MVPGSRGVQITLDDYAGFSMPHPRGTGSTMRRLTPLRHKAVSRPPHAAVAVVQAK